MPDLEHLEKQQFSDARLRIAVNFLPNDKFFRAIADFCGRPSVRPLSWHACPAGLPCGGGGGVSVGNSPYASKTNSLQDFGRRETSRLFSIRARHRKPVMTRQTKPTVEPSFLVRLWDAIRVARMRETLSLLGRDR